MDAPDLAQLNSANRLDLMTSADAFAATATKIISADRAAARAREAAFTQLNLA
ncbi:hypothetical protein D3C87_2170250 [compost metagenome]